MIGPFSVALVALLLASVTLSAVAQLLLKLGAPRVVIGSDLIGTAGSLLLNWQVMGGLACYGLSVLLWIRVLAKLDLSLAYPFVSLGFLLTMAFGALILHEPVGGQRIAGTALVVLGCVLVARSA